MTTRVKGRFTFRFAAVCFALSAVFELPSLQDEAVLFDHIVGGLPALAYHLVYAVLFTVLAHGLWYARRSGYYALWVASVIYTVDRLQMLFVGNALARSLDQQIAEHPEVLQIISAADLLQILTATTLAFLIGWWGFVGYAWYRRNYFGIGISP
ncbi:MAG: hypothetical protein EPO06_03165 [Burkholderiaceae bacterium]|nr:MAG: hypothetical protein EPO06_03165 [Burkholderiaceae bacterium]